MANENDLQRTIDELVQAGKGILAADESQPTIEKRFAAINIPADENNRRHYRQLLLSAEGLGEHISGVILFDETLSQHTEAGKALTAFAIEQGIVPGVKVDKGLQSLAGSEGEKITEGLDGLAQRLEDYKAQGARFAKWRCVYRIQNGQVSNQAMLANAEVLARYAAICQQQTIVPIVEPEVLMDGNHSIEVCAQVTEAVQHAVFNALDRHHVALEHMLLKPNMVLPGEDATTCSPAEVAKATLQVIRRSVPSAVPSINFLSGGQSPEEASDNLAAINVAAGAAPWLLSFSYGRALQQPVLHAWSGHDGAKAAAQDALLLRAKLNGDTVSCPASRTSLSAA